MTAQAVQNPLPTLTGLDGLPLSGGYVYFGQENADPIAAPVTVYYDAAQTIPAAQPLRTEAGFVMRNGAPAALYASGAFSMLVKDSKNRQVLFAPSVTGFSAANISFLQAGAGATARTVQDKARELVSPLDFGAVGNASADDSAGVSAALVASDTVRNGGAGRRYLAGLLQLGTSTRLLWAKLLGKTGLGEFVRLPANTDGVHLVGVDIEAQAGIALHQNSASSMNTAIIGGRIKADAGYALLSNSASDGSDGMLVLGANIESTTADAVEWNHPNKLSYNFTLVGSLVKADSGSANLSSGFAVGVAGTQGHITVGNHVRKSRNTAFHIEDGQKRGIVGFNTVQSAVRDGVTIQAAVGGTQDGVTLVGNHLLHTGTKTTFSGVWNIYDANGSVQDNIVANNQVRGFGTGYTLDGFSAVLSSANFSRDCDVGVKMPTGTVALGQWHSRDTPVLASSGGGGILGKLTSTTTPTDILTRIGARMPGPYAKGFLIPVVINHDGGSVMQNAPLFVLPARMAGRLTVQFTKQADTTKGFIYSTDVLWDGTTLTLSNKIEHYFGTLSAAVLVNDGGTLALRFFSVDAVSSNSRVDFDGVFYQS